MLRRLLGELVCYTRTWPNHYICFYTVVKVDDVESWKLATPDFGGEWRGHDKPIHGKKHHLLSRWCKLSKDTMSTLPTSSNQTRKNIGLGHLKTRWFTIKSFQHCWFWGSMVDTYNHPINIHEQVLSPISIPRSNVLTRIEKNGHVWMTCLCEKSSIPWDSAIYLIEMVCMINQSRCVPNL